MAALQNCVSQYENFDVLQSWDMMYYSRETLLCTPRAQSETVLPSTENPTVNKEYMSVPSRLRRDDWV